MEVGNLRHMISCCIRGDPNQWVV